MSDRPLLLLIYLHGFKGDDSTFLKFPERLNHICQETLPDVQVESVVFPAYETKGDLKAATDRFVEWLTTLVVERESADARAGPGRKARVVLCGHSMGGLLAADAILNIAGIGKGKDGSESKPLWPQVIGLLAFDTPYLGLHPNVFKNTLTKATTHAQQARDVVAAVSVMAPAVLSAFSWGAAKKATTPPPTAATPEAVALATDDSPTSSRTRSKTAPSSSSSSSHTSLSFSTPQESARAAAKPDLTSTPAPSLSAAAGTSSSGWGRFSVPAMYGLGAAAVAAAGAGAYMKRNDLGQSLGLGMGWAQDHLKYVGNLWDGEALKARLEALDALVRERKLVFRNFYTLLPQTQGQILPRTFCILPQPGGTTRGAWLSARNGLARDEVQAHTEMFAPKSNDNYYDLGLRASEAAAYSYAESLRLDVDERDDDKMETPIDLLD